MARYTKLKLFGMLPRSLRRRIMFRRYEHEIAETGEAELPELRHHVRRGDLVLDVGANLGAYSYELARLTGRVIAFVPNPVLARLLAGLAIAGVEVRQTALGAGDGNAELVVPHSHGGHGHATLRRDPGFAQSSRIQVPTARLDGLKLDRVSFIKIDVEGFEEEALAGGMETIERDRPTLLIEIEERQNPGGLARIADKLAPLGYRGVFLSDGVWHSIAEFVRDQDQNVDVALERAFETLPRRQVRYINNFLFKPTIAPAPPEAIHGKP